MAQDQPYYTSDFHDKRQMWRRLFAECLGTFALVLVAAGGEAVAAVFGVPGRPAIAVSSGLMVMAMIYTVGDVSGAHINPAITWAFALRKDMPWRRTFGYWGAQLVGAVLGALLVRAAFGLRGNVGTTSIGPGVPLGLALLTEVVLTTLLATVVIGTASGAKLVGHNSGLVVGGYIALAGLIAGPITGASMNPARSLGSAIAAASFGDAWIYVVGPVIGATIGVGFARILHGRRTNKEIEAAQGTPRAQDS